MKNEFNNQKWKIEKWVRQFVALNTRDPTKGGTSLVQTDFWRFQYVFNTIFTVATPGVSLGEYAFPRPPAVSLPLGPFSSSVCGPISSSDFKPISERPFSDSSRKLKKLTQRSLHLLSIYIYIYVHISIYIYIYT